MMPLIASLKRMRRRAPSPPCHCPAPPEPRRMLNSSSTTGYRSSRISGSVMRVLVMWVWMALVPSKPGPAPVPPQMVS